VLKIRKRGKIDLSKEPVSNSEGECMSNYKRVRQSYLSRIMASSEVSIFIPLLVLVVIISLLKPQFLDTGNVSAILKALAFLGIVAIGETLVILAGEFDVSVGSVAGLGAIISTWLITRTSLGIIGSIFITLVLCSLVGLINGFCVVKLKVHAFIATIATLYIVRGMAIIISKGYPIYPLPESLLEIGKMKPFGTSIPFILFIVLIFIFEFILRRTEYGRSIYATGNNKEVAKLAGINITFVKLSAFILSSVLAALAGILLAAQLQTGSPTIGMGFELQVVAATAIGGISLVGGAGTMIGTLIGILIMAVLNNGLVLLGINTFIQSAVQGLVMILAVLVDILRRSKKVRS
jgi:ribose transport system permease protein